MRFVMRAYRKLQRSGHAHAWRLPCPGWKALASSMPHFGGLPADGV